MLTLFTFRRRVARGRGNQVPAAGAEDYAVLFCVFVCCMFLCCYIFNYQLTHYDMLRCTAFILFIFLLSVRRRQAGKRGSMTTSWSNCPHSLHPEPDAGTGCRKRMGYREICEVRHTRSEFVFVCILYIRPFTASNVSMFKF